MSDEYNKDCWTYWYPRKVGTVESEIPKLELLLARTRQNTKQKILDVGCGTGRHSIYFARRKEFEVYGFDASPLAVKLADEELKNENLSGQLAVHDMAKPFEYQNSFFDAVISTRVIGHAYAEQVKMIAREIDRVLKDNGYLYLQVPSHTSEMRTIKEQGGIDKVKFVDEMTHLPFEGPEKMIPHHHFTREHIAELFPNYSTLDLHEESDHYNGICFIGQKKGTR